MSRFAAVAAICVVLAGCASLPTSRVVLPAPPAHPDGQLLWHIVHDHCVPGQATSDSPAPCADVEIAQGVARGYAVLKDRVGTSQYLVMPTTLLSGIEDPRLLRTDAANYFTAAWKVRRLVAARVGANLARQDIGIAVNSRYGRSQDLLHLHVDCLRLDVRAALDMIAPTVRRRWSRQTVTLANHRYYAIRVEGDEHLGANPFRLLAAGLHVPPSDMAAWTLVLAGAHFSGEPGFVLLAARADPQSGDTASGEVLQDHQCTGRTLRPV